jgi:hypothetical protein
MFKGFDEEYKKIYCEHCHFNCQSTGMLQCMLAKLVLDSDGIRVEVPR